MGIEISDMGPILLASGLDVFQQSLGISIPEDYFAFLLKYNGGSPSPDVVDIAGFPGQSTDVRLFFRLGSEIESSDLRWNAELFSAYVEDGVLPIAHDSCGGIFCIWVSGEFRGQIIFLDYGYEDRPQYFVAESFSALLEMLYELPE